MQRPERVALGAASLVAVLAVSGAGLAQDEAPGDQAGEATEQEDLPPGHPPVDDGSDSNPHARAGAGQTPPGIFNPPQDGDHEDASLAAGTIAVDLRDADDHPVRAEMVTLGVMISSVAKGDSRKHLQATTDGGGRAVFSGLESTSNVAYRVSAGFQGGSFAAPPFRLDQKGRRVVLHVYPVVHDLQRAFVVAEVTVAGEVRDDRVQMEEVLTLYNLGRTAWQPDDVRLSLPEGFKALSGQPTMSGQGVDEVEGTAKLRGTFGPGRHTIEFQWQLPWSGDRDVDFDVGLPPHVAGARVMMPVMAGTTLSVGGLPPAEVKRDSQGQRFLVTERTMRPDDPKLAVLAIGIHGLPTQGPGRIVATLIAACGVAVGLALGFSRRSRVAPRRDAKAARAVLLDELAQLERARLSGEVGPKTYDRVRGELIDSLARTLA
ncbi:MAG TPA: hypothetical protein VE987_05175 [Polyangiaceae bacterium]|nr:hypothetical protein [Polyangiaceae bacterium]